MIVSVIFFLIIINTLIVVHEYGHYIIARRNGINVKEFFVGVGPRLIKWHRGGTEFSIRPFLFGGACVFEGQDALEEERAELSEGSYPAATVWARFATTLAGPLFNVILAYLASVILMSQTGAIIPEVKSVEGSSAAMEAGLMPGDIITAIDLRQIHFSTELSFISYFSKGDPMTVTYKRDGKKYKTTLYPKYSDEDKRYYMGVVTGELVECGFLDSIKYGFFETDYIVWSTVQSLRMLVTGTLGKDALSGPVGMVKMVDETYDAVKPYGFKAVVLSMLELMIMLSANLAVINLLPIPGLDGGRLLFIIIEMIRKKPISPEKEGYVTLAGMALLLVLVVFVFFNDITKFFR